MTTTRWTIAGSLLAWTLIIGAGPLRGEQPAEQIMADLKTKSAAVKSFRADTTTTMQMMGKDVSTWGNILFKKPKKTRAEMSTDMGAMKMHQIHISDGKTTWVYQPKMNLAMKIDMEKVVAETKEKSAGEKTEDISQPFQSCQEESISHVRTDEFDGGKVHVFQAQPKKSDRKKTPFDAAKIEVWLGADDGLIRKMITLDEEGNRMMSQSYTNIQLNVEAADGQFEFTPPEGVQVVDMTKGMINMTKEMKGEAE